MATRAVSVRVEEALWRRLKVKAAEDGKTVSSLVEAGMLWVLAGRPLQPPIGVGAVKELRTEKDEPIP